MGWRRQGQRFLPRCDIQTGIGFATGAPNLFTSLPVAATALTIPADGVQVASGFATPDLLDWWWFAGATDTLASGDLIHTNGQPVIPATNWTRDQSIYYNSGSGQSIRQTYNVGGNTGQAAYYAMGAGITEFYQALWYYQAANGGTPFNDSNQDFVKFMRVQAAGFGSPGPNFSVGICPGGKFCVGWDDVDSITPHGVQQGSINMNDTQDAWVHVECYRNIGSATYTGSGPGSDTGTMTIWVNGVQATTRTDTDLTIPIGYEFRTVHFLGLINSITTQSTAYLGGVALSTQRIGYP